jgi:hypothetical protein
VDSWCVRGLANDQVTGMRLHEDHICHACCPVQAGEALAPECVNAKAIDALPCNCKATPSPLVVGSETGVGWSLKWISMVTWQRKHIILKTGGCVYMGVSVNQGHAYACTR